MNADGNANLDAIRSGSPIERYRSRNSIACLGARASYIAPDTRPYTMPELPEVEITRRKIEPALLGRTISVVKTTAPSYFFLTPPAQLKRELRGESTTGVRRLGKYLLLDFDSGNRLFLHLGMTGQLFVEGAANKKLTDDKHVHLALSFEDTQTRVLFRDVRKFGKVRWLTRGTSDARLDKLGPDALLTPVDALEEHIWNRSRKRKIAVKTLLLNQSVLAGVGNIYADESLFLAGIRPSRGVGRLRRKDITLLTRAVQTVLQRSIETGGSSISDYVSPDGADGKNQAEHQVYARGDQPCYRCDTSIKRIVIGARSTHYCPHCQA